MCDTTYVESYRYVFFLSGFALTRREKKINDTYCHLSTLCPLFNAGLL